MAIEDEASLIRKAEVFLNKGNIKEAEIVLSAALKKHPGSQKIKMVLADVFRALSRFGDAIVLYSGVIKQKAKHIQAANNLARIHIHLGQFQLAETIWDDVITAHQNDPKLLKRAASMFAHFGQKPIAEKFLMRANDIHFDGELTSFMLTALRGKDIPDRVPEAFVQRHFDNAAHSYDTHLAAIGNAGPQKIASILQELDIPQDASLTTFDAGCGTGLCGSILRPYSNALHGVDLSSEMLKLADDRGCYDELRQADLIAFLKTGKTSYDLIIAADVLSYFGPLEEVTGLFSNRLSSNGLLIFSIELVPSNMAVSEGYMLSPNGRYKHMKDYVLGVLAGAGFARPVIADRFALRNEYGEPVYSLGVAAYIA